MQNLSRTEGETVLDELAVFLRTETFEDLASSVFIVAEKRVSDVLHVDAYLMRASGL